MDINMPEMDGMEATAAIRQWSGALSRIPIIAMTALAMPGDMERFLSLGMDSYISKPIIREELHACIDKVLKGLELLPATTSSSNDIKLTDTETSIVDTKILSVLIGNVGAERLPHIIDVYLSEIPAWVDAITVAAARGNCELVAKEAHPLNSSSASFGAMALAELASQLEQAGREHDLEKIALEVLHLPSLLEQTREALLKVQLGK
jgi:CheY-like chemotaxis protein